MAERSQEATSTEMLEDIFEPVFGDLLDDDDDFIPVSQEKLLLVEKRRRAEERLEARRLRDELGYYDLDD